MPGCITQGETLEEALEMIREALEGMLIAADKDGETIAPPFQAILDALKVK